MSALSSRTEQLVRCMFKAAEVWKLRVLLENECGTEALACRGWTPEQMERIHFAVIRLGKESPEALSEAVKLAQTDWRDLLMVAGFGEDLEAHSKWFNDVAC
jgi:hypothetical protein